MAGYNKQRMKVSELRNGNYFETWDGKIEKVWMLTDRSVNGFGCDKNAVKKFLPKPISLTEEWLVRLGLVRDGKRRIYCKGEFKVDIGMMHIYWQDKRILNKTAENYRVHRLQNLYFELTDEELTSYNTEQ